MIRGRTGDDGELEFFSDDDPGTVVAAVTADGVTGAVGGSVTSEDITDATEVGRAVLTAEDEAAAQAAIGADGGLMTSTAASVDDADTFADLDAATAAYNSLLAALRDRGVLATS